MMLHGSNPTTALEALVAHLTQHYESDLLGRIVASEPRARVPRFVLARAAEGCVWRFGSGLPDAVVIAVARLAGREPGLGGRAPRDAPPPERLAMMERLFAQAGLPVSVERELVRRADVEIGELWICMASSAAEGPGG